MQLTRLFDLAEHQLKHYDRADSLNHKVKGQWKSFSCADLIHQMNKVSNALLKLGLGKDSKVAIISENRPEWNFIDLGVQQIGGISVPLYPTITIEDYHYIFNHAEVQIVFVSTAELYNKAKKAAEGTDVKQIISFDQIDNVKQLDEFIDTSEQLAITEINQLKDQVKSDDIFTLIYTSGTTGVPKGVMLSHKNVLSNTMAISNRVLYEEGISKALSFLPLSHIFERVGFFLYLYNGVGVYYAESMEKISDNLKEVQPHGFNTVPRLLEKIYDKIVAKGREAGGIKKVLFFWALNLGLKFDPGQPSQGFWYDFQLKIAQKIIFSKWKAALGGAIKMIPIGGAALQPRLCSVFWAAGIHLLEGYGLTETSPVITASSALPGGARLGAAGFAVDDVKISFAADGEILIKGPNVMKGYYKAPEQTAEVIDQEGWFHTGDIGELTNEGYLKITDRKKEMFKTSGGKYVAPQLLENKLKESFLIEQVMVIGENRKFPAALISPNLESLNLWCEEHDVPVNKDVQLLLKEPAIIQKFQEEIDKQNSRFAQWEKVKKFALLPTEWSIEGGEFTPKMSIKRKVINKKYAQYVEEIYADN